MMRLCKKCGETKPTEAFYVSLGPCKACRIALAAASKAKRKAADPEGFRAKNAALAKAAYRADPETARAKNKAWRDANLDLARAAYARNYAKDQGRRQRVWQAANKPLVLERIRKRRAENIEAARKKVADWRAANREKELAARRSKYAEQPELGRQTAKEWRAANPSKVAAQIIARRQALEHRTPDWLNDAHFAEMDGFYLFCRIFRQTGPWNVDHVLPIRGKSVSGLHVPWNLQILSKVDNIRKGNKVEEGT